MKTTSFALGIVVLMGSAVFAQQAAKPANNAKPRFTLTISTEHETVTSGSKVVVTVHLTNVSDHQLSFPWSGFGGPDPTYRVEIRDSQGKMAPFTEDYNKRLHREPPYDQPTTGRSVGYYVDRGETVTQEFEVAKQYDLRAIGKYTIRVIHPDREANLDVQSNAITLAVTQ